MVAGNPVVIFSKSTCCMCHSIKRLFYELGANPKVFELDEIDNGREIEAAIPLIGRSTAVPAVYLGGEFEGGANEILVLQIKNLLRPKLVNVGAI